ncbi:uncharacterized protein LOC135217202 [Macrobrachium nipponense]|uniref:uncharacterized protein LOC135217202 n=1 Tax=Macrobrachium nipponense TaxID=159736 RepID=UPI0030C89BA1
MASFFKLISVLVVVVMGFILVSEAASEVQDAAPQDQLTVLEIIGSPRMKRSPGQADAGFFGKNKGMKGDFDADSHTFALGWGQGATSRLGGRFSGEGEFSGGSQSKVTFD